MWVAKLQKVFSFLLKINVFITEVIKGVRQSCVNCWYVPCPLKIILNGTSPELMTRLLQFAADQNIHRKREFKN